jgi:hypothetical protein
MKEAANDSDAVLHERDPCRGNKDMSDRPAATFDLDQLLHPAQAFGHPSEVVNDPDLTTHEKRAILSSWVSDACAEEAAPELRRSLVRVEEIMEGLRALDNESKSARYWRVISRRRVFGRGWRTNQTGASLR